MTDGQTWTGFRETSNRVGMPAGYTGAFVRQE